MVSRPRPDAPERQVWRLMERVDRLENGAPLRATSVSGGQTRFIGPNSIIVVGSGRVDGTWLVNGHLQGAGEMNWTGPWQMLGNGSILGNLVTSGTTTLGGSVLVTGDTTVAGNFGTIGDTTLGGTVHIVGDTELDADLSLGSGRILVGPITIDTYGDYGGRIASSGYLDMVGSVVRMLAGQAIITGGLQTGATIRAENGDIRAENGDIIGNAKLFSIPHPSKPGRRLDHGSLEGPEHGVYYRGRVTFDDRGEAVFTLPDYVPALILDDDEPTVLVTPVGAPFPVGADDVTGGSVAVYGSPGRSAHVVVIAARGHLDVEPVDQAS